MSATAGPNKNTNLIVKNLTGTSDNECTCERSWIKHWQKCTKSKRVTCGASGCSNDAKHGGHVKIADGRVSDKLWIVPLCPTHNNSANKGEFALNMTITLVSASVNETCKQPDVNKWPTHKK